MAAMDGIPLSIGGKRTAASAAPENDKAAAVTAAVSAKRACSCMLRVWLAPVAVYRCSEVATRLRDGVEYSIATEIIATHQPLHGIVRPLVDHTALTALPVATR